MNRDDALSLLKELRAAFFSFEDAQIVTVTKEKGADSWFLCAKWIPEEYDKPVLNGIALKHGVEISEEKGFTCFRPPAKSV